MIEFWKDLIDELEERWHHLRDEGEASEAYHVWRARYHAEWVLEHLQKGESYADLVQRDRGLYGWYKRFRCGPVALEHIHDAEDVVRATAFKS